VKDGITEHRSFGNEERYLTRLLAEHGMPVLLHIKPANTIMAYKKYIGSLSIFTGGLQKIAEEFDCRVSVLYENDTLLFLMLYQPEKLRTTLKLDKNRRFLCKCGYQSWQDSIDACIHTLSGRYRRYKEQGEGFPHEIGIFLGYPIEDVEGFIKNKGENYLFRGCWKVYGNVEEAKKIFEQIRFAREIGRKFLS